MKFKKTLIISLSSFIAATATTACAVVPFVGQSNVRSNKLLATKKIFNVKDDTLYGFNEGITTNDLEQYIISNNGLKLPNVKKIADYAFASFNTKFNLNVNDLPIPIPATVEEIGDHAFYDSDITELTFEKGSKCRLIGKSAFAFCDKLTKVEIPPYVCSNSSKNGIRERAFYCCKALNTLDFTKTNVDVSGAKTQFNWHETAFVRISQTGKLICNVTTAHKTKQQAGVIWTRAILSGLNRNWVQCNKTGTAIKTPWHPIPNEFYKFDTTLKTKLIGYNESWLTGKWADVFNMAILPIEAKSIDFYNGSHEQSGNFFIKCNSILKNQTLEYCSNLKALPEYAFDGIENSNFTVTVPPKLEEIGRNAFSNSKFNIKGLTKLLAPGGTIKKICNGAFKTCLSPDLKKITLKTDIVVEDYAFMAMSNLTSLDLVAYGKTPTYAGWGEHCFMCTTPVKRTVTLIEDEHKNTLDQWRIAQNWMPWFTQQGMNIADDEWSILPKGSQLKYEEIFKVEEGECKGWITDYQGKVPKEEEFDVLLGDRTTLTLPETITKIGESAFAVKNEQGELVSTIPDNITTIDFSTSKVTDIGKNAFINLPETVKTLKFGGDILININDSAFENGQFTKIEGLDATTSLQTIGNKVFYNCAKVSEFSTRDYESGVFLDNLTKLKTIGNDAFARWDAMTDEKILKLTKSLTSIGRNAFYANKFSTVEIPQFKFPITIGNNAFAQDTTIEDEKINCISVVEYEQLTKDPPWELQEGSYIFAGVAKEGTILIGPNAPESQIQSMKKYFAKQSEEIKRYDWTCKRQE